MLFVCSKPESTVGLSSLCTTDAESAAKEAAESKLREGEGMKEEMEGGEGERGGEVAECVNPLKPFSDYYLQAENSVEALVGIRCAHYRLQHCLAK